MSSLIEVKKKTPAKWQEYIGTSLRKTAEATLDTAKRIAEYRISVEEDEFNKSMKQWFGFSPSHLSYWSKIADSLPRFEEHCDKLPASPRTLYELSGIDDDLWDEFIETGEINPSVTVDGAKSLKVNGGLKKATANKYGDADNFLEIMQKLDEIMSQANSIKDAKKLIGKWIKENPPLYPEDEEDIEDAEVIEHEPQESKTAKEAGISSQTRVKCLALFGIYVDKPIIDKDVLTLLDKMAGNDETKLAAIETLESE